MKIPAFASATICAFCLHLRVWFGKFGTDMGLGFTRGVFIIGVVCLVLGVWKRGRGSDWPFLRCRVAIAVESLGGLSSCERSESLAFATGLFAQAKLKGTWELLIRDREMLVSS